MHSYMNRNSVPSLHFRCLGVHRVIIIKESSQVEASTKYAADILYMCLRDARIEKFGPVFGDGVADVI